MRQAGSVRFGMLPSSLERRRVKTKSLEPTTMASGVVVVVASSSTVNIILSIH